MTFLNTQKLRNILILFIVFYIASCTSNPNNPTEEPAQPKADNEELIGIYKNDQNDRKTSPIDWNIVSGRDSLREVRIYEMLDSNLVQTSLDYHNAAMIFQHGGDSIAYGMAVKLMRRSIELDSTANKWLLAAAIDRYLLSKDEPQIYGTQYSKKGKDAPWALGKIDTTQITDAERKLYGVETLAEQREKERRMNLKKISELMSDGRSVIDLIGFIKNEDIPESKYDFSERALNSFGYSLISQKKKEDALKIFKLNTELYPSAFNTFDSYGECLLDLGDTTGSIIAYKKSLELNTKNENAVKVWLN